MTFRQLLAGALTALTVMVCAALPASAQTVTRGPYLQSGTPMSVVVKWRTDVPADSRVRFGPDPGDLLWWTDDGATTTEHAVTLATLSPNTTYYYSVGTTATILAGGDTTYYFTTPPLQGTSKPTRIWVLGDPGTANADAAAVRNAYTAYTGTRYTDIILMLGDNAYLNGTDVEYQAAVFDMYPTYLRQSVMWSAFGNHDAISADSATQSGPYFDILTVPKQAEAGGVASGTEAYYSFNYGDIHFVALDSSESDRSPTGPMLTWLRSDLAANTQRWLVAFWHHPPYSKGTQSSDTDVAMVEMRQNAVPILEDFGVDLVLAGHSHSYERSFLIDGHYDVSSTFSVAMKKDGGSGQLEGSGAYVKVDGIGVPHQGAVYAVLGSSGKTAGGALNHPAMFASLNTLGSMVLDVNGDTLDAVFLDSTGVTRDHFTIDKGTPLAPAALSATAPASTQVQLAWTDTSSSEVAFSVERAGSNGVFAEIGTVAGNVTGYTDTIVTAATTYSYRVRALSAHGASGYSNTASVTTPAPPAQPQLLKTISFEDGSLTHVVTGADAVSGGVTLETAAPLRGTRSARISGSSAYLEEDFTASADLYLTFYLRLTALPSSDTRLVLITNNGNTVGNVLLRTTGQLRLKVNNTIIGADSVALVPGTPYRMGVHQRAAAGSIPRLLEAFVVSGDADFGAAFASTTTTSWSGNADRLRLGNTNGAVTAVIDEIRLDGAVMPGPSSSTPATAPTGLGATAPSSSAVLLTWTDTASSETGFRIERAGTNGVYAEIGSVAANVTTFTDATIAVSTLYNYRVRASSAVGLSAYSNVATLTTPPPPPTAPTTLSATAPTSAAVQLTWADKSTTETGFSIERAPSGGVYAVVGTVAANVITYADPTVSGSTAYSYRVRATNTGGASAYSNVASVTTPAAPPAAPSNLVATAPVSSQVLLTWTDGSTTETAFRIERAGTSGVFAEVATVAANVTGFSDATVSGSTAYSYRVRASNAIGFSPYSNVATVTTPAPPPPPDAPAALTATALSGQVQLAWTDLATTETAYVVERAGTSGVFAEIGTMPANATGYVDGTVTASTAYSYRVRAINTGGPSAYSNVATVTTPGVVGLVIKAMTFEDGALVHAVSGADAVSGSPTVETAAPLRGAKSARIASSAYLEEDFTAAPDFYLSFYLRMVSLPSSDTRLVLITNNGSTVGNLTVRSTGQLRLKVNSTVIGLDSAALVAGTTYRIGVHQRAAVGATTRLLEAFVVTGDAEFGAPFASTTTTSWSGNADRLRLGNTSGSVTAVLDEVRLNGSVMPGPTLPTPIPPTGVSASATSAASVQLTWTDPSTNETAFHIERSTGGGAYVEIGTVAPNVTGYVDSTVAPSTAYTYRLRSATAAGFSAYSAVATVTTPALPPAPAAPSGLGASPTSGGAVQLAWTDASSNETSFRIERADLSGVFVEIGSVATNIKVYTDATVAASTGYSYRVRAANPGGFSAYSNAVGITTPIPPPTAPTGLIATAPSSTQVRLTWTDTASNETSFSIERAGTNGVFAQIVTVPANTTTFTDAPLTASTAHSYRLRSANSVGVSAYSNVAAVTTLPPPPPGEIKALTFEGGSLTDATTGADVIAGSPTLEITSPVKGQFSAAFNGIGYLEKSFPAASDLYLSFYLRLTALLPTTGGDVRLVQISNNGVPVGELLLRASTGKLRLRVSGTNVGLDSAALASGEIYRIGVHQRAGTGATAVIEGFLTSDDTAFAAPFAALTTGTWIDGADRIRLGASTGVALQGVLDDALIETLAMAAPSGGPPPAVPSAPSSLSANAPSSAAVLLTWTDTSTTETMFRIERAGSDGVFAEIAAVLANGTSFTDTAVVATSPYSYRVRASNAGGPSTYSNVVAVITPIATVPEAAPTGLAATSSTGTQVQLTWIDASTNETAFRIERATAGGEFTEVGTVTTNVTTYTDLTAAGTTTYTYRVRASNGIGFSAYSTPVDVTTPEPRVVIKAMTFEDDVLVHAVTGADAIAGSVSVNSTTPVKGLHSLALAGPGYVEESFPAANDLYLSFYLRLTTLLPTSGGDVRLVQITNGGVAVGEVMLRGSTGRLRLRINGVSVGADSAPLLAGELYRVGVHQRAGTGATAVLESFLAAGDAPFGAAFAGTATGTWLDGADRVRLGASTSVALQGVLDDARLETTGMPEPSASQLPAPPPEPVALGAAAVTAGAVQLTWTDVAVTETLFRIERADSSGVFAEIGTVVANTTSYTDATVTPLTLYSYRVLAANAGGASNYSDVATVTTLPAPPSAPSTLVATPVSSSSVALTWQDTSLLETGFVIERAGISGIFAEVGNAAANATGLTDPTATASSTYTYRVRAVNTGGFSPYSNSAVVSTPAPPPPAAPTGLIALAQGSSVVQTTWTDASTTETGFAIERAGTNGVFAAVGTVAANITTYSDTTVSVSTSYTYRVRAVNGQVASAYSNTASVITPAAGPSALVLKAMTFEDGVLTHLVTGADAVSGSPTVETTAPLRGTKSARISSSAYLEEDFPATSDFYLSFYLRLTALPSSDTRLVLITNNGSTVGNVLVRSTGQLRLRANGTTIGSDSAALVAGTVYRIGVHQRAAIGALPRLLEAFVIAGDAPFGAPFATTTTTSWSGNADRLRLGNTSGSVTAVLDEVRLDAATMPGPTYGTVPTAPAALSATAASTTSVQLAWTDASANESGFAIERSTGGGSFAEIGNVAANVTNYTDTALTPATAYTYRVRASNVAGYSAYATSATATTLSPPPSAPAGLTAAAPDTTQVTLSWTDTSTNEAAFRIERSAAGGGFVEIGTAVANATTYVDSPVSASTAYSYRVRAANVEGLSPYSNTANVTTPAPPPVGQIKGMTFEAGSLTDSATGADAISGSVSITTAAPIRGTNSAALAGPGYLEENFTSADDVFVSFYLRLTSLLPTAGGDVRLLQITNNGVTVGEIMLRASTGKLRLRVNGATVGSDSVPLVAGELYRIGIRQRAGTGATGLVDAFLVSGETAFGAAFAGVTTGLWTDGATRVRVGASTSVGLQAVLDEVRLNTVAMPEP